MLRKLSPYWLWVILAIPAFAFINDAFTSTDPKVFKHLLHPTGEFGARLLIITMIATPLGMLLKGWRGPRWLKKNRRYFGVAAFGYASLHLLIYVIDRATLSKMFGEITTLDMWTGWLAFLIFLPLAATSFDAAIKAMGPRWKTVQRIVYAAAVLTLIHWAAHDEWKGLVPAMVHFLPLIALEAYRIWYWYLRPRKPRLAQA